MNGALLRDAFAHHTWATHRLLDACNDLASEQRTTSVPGTFGPIIVRLRQGNRSGAGVELPH
jgi:uncharacterized damage-inducible protein DinB